MKKIAAYFGQGLLFLIPIVATIYVLYIVFLRIDQIFDFDIPGLGFLLMLSLVTITGFLVSTVLARSLTNLIDSLFNRMPVGKMIYSSVKDMMSAFVGDEKQFNQPVMVSLLPGSGIQLMGFITREFLSDLGAADSAAVYVPQAFNLGGFVIIANRDQITTLEIDSGRAMAFMVSGGVSSLKGKNVDDGEANLETQ
jgi:uncharacterized membrane protein